MQRGCSLRFSAKSTPGRSSSEAGLHVRAVRKRRVSSVWPSQLERINGGHFGTDRQNSSCAGTGEATSPRTPARGVARSSGPKGARSLIERRVPSAMVPKRDFQTRPFRRARFEQSGSSAENSEKVSARASDAPPDGRGGEFVPGGVRTPGEVDCTSRYFRGDAARRNSGSSLEGPCGRHSSGGRARLQTCFEYAEKRQEARGRYLGRPTQFTPRVGQSGGRPEARGLRISVREADNSTFSRQPLAKAYAADAGEDRARVGKFSDAQKNKRQPFQEGGCRSKGCLRSEGPRTRSHHGGLHEFGHGAEARSSQKTRSRGASKTTTRKSVSRSEVGLTE